MQRSARAYTAGAQAPAASRDTGNDAQTNTALPETAAPGDQPPAVLSLLVTAPDTRSVTTARRIDTTVSS